MEVRDIRERQTFTISLPPDLAAEVDQVAEREHRTRSELFREAFRQYVLRQRQLDAMFAYGQERGREVGPMSDEEIVQAVHEYRRETRRQQRAVASGA